MTSPTPHTPNPNEPQAPNDHAVLERHEGPVRTPQQLIVAVIASFAIPILAIALLISLQSNTPKKAPGTNLNDPKAVAARIGPVAKSEWKDASAPRILKAGEEVYKAQCAVCHAAGAAGAPKFGDAGAWSARLGQGYAALLNSSLKGKGAMGAQGGGDYDDLEIGRAVVYMTNAAGGKFAEPQAAVAAPAASAPAAAAAPADGAPNAVQAALAAAAATTVAAKPATADAGKAVYDKYCVACHAAGVANAPKFADAAAWAPRIKTGMPALYASVIKGKGAMAARGGAPADTSDADLNAAVDYMVKAAK
jgi:cytochrome c5